MTTRGIPQVYYGTELMMGHEDRGGDDEAGRQTMPGGWPDDTRSVFTESGRTPKENEILAYVTKLTQWRKTAIGIHEGKLVHFIPENNVYVYFRVHENQTIMVVLNGNEESITLHRNRFSEILDRFETGVDVLSGEEINLSKEIQIRGKSAGIWELK